MNLAFNNRWIRIIKDVLFFGIAIWLVTRKSWLTVFAGVLAAYWYGRDAYYQLKALWQEKTFKPQEPEETRENKAPIITENLADAKEVDYEKE
ncbi:MAG: hypothetical protein J6M31_02680 [Bacteroidales bacterium]|nr:hypothetical protein [Bacteroidales bacterium]